MEKNAHQDRLLRHGWRGGLALYAAWTVPALIVTAGFAGIGSPGGSGESLSSVLVKQLAFYWFFASLCPPAYRLARRFPFGRRNWPVALAVHAALVPLVLSAELVLSAVVSSLLRGRTGGMMDAVVTEFTSPQGQWRAVVNIFYCVMVVGAVSLIRQNRRRQAQEQRAASLALRTSLLETQVAQARLQALEMQLNPHFLFNALNSIASLIQQKRPDDAYRAVELLGDLLRETLAGEGRRMVTLDEELSLLGRYLELEGIRFSDRLHTAITMEEACREWPVPAMILQPLVENAVRHALAARAEAGHIEIAARRGGEVLVLEVRDDGPGLPVGWNLDDDAGVGLDNVRQRLEAHYGPAGALELGPNTPHGVICRLTLPVPAAGSKTAERRLA